MNNTEAYNNQVLINMITELTKRVKLLESTLNSMSAGLPIESAHYSAIQYQDANQQQANKYQDQL